jgi:hypothetical protein
MYGLPKAGILAQELLETRLNKHCYRQSPLTLGLWRHDFLLISFTLCVDDFGIEYVGRKHAKHFASVRNEHYKCKLEWEGQRYLGMDIDWDYTGRTDHVSMLEYIPEALTQFQQPPPRIPQHQPYPHIKPNYNAKAQITENVDTSPLLDKTGKKYIQEDISTFLYYACCVDSTMLPGLGSLASQQSNPTKNTKNWSINSLTMPPRILMPSSLIKQATWCLLDTAMPPTSQTQMHAVTPAATSSCQTMTQYPPTTEQSTKPPKSSKQWCHLRLKWKLGLSTSTAEKQSHHDTHSNS